jgi:hypothetical protein
MAKTKFERRAVDIALGYDDNSGNFQVADKMEVEALCCGPLAIHKCVANRRPHYRISHIPTGLAVCASSSILKAKKTINVLLASELEWERITARKARAKAMRRKATDIAYELQIQGLIISTHEGYFSPPYVPLGGYATAL